MAVKVITGEVRLSYLNVWEAKAFEEGATPKFSATLVIPKTDKATVKKINGAIEESEKAGKAKYGEKFKMIKGSPLKDGDAKDCESPEYAGCFYIRTSTASRPFLFDRRKQQISDRAEIYSGCYGIASINIDAFQTKSGTNKGVTAYLNGIQKTRDGESLGGQYTAAEADNDFKAIEDEEDDI